MYISGGFKGPFRGHLDKLWRYNVEEDSWTTLASMLTVIEHVIVSDYRKTVFGTSGTLCMFMIVLLMNHECGFLFPKSTYQCNDITRYTYFRPHPVIRLTILFNSSFNSNPLNPIFLHIQGRSYHSMASVRDGLVVAGGVNYIGRETFADVMVSALRECIGMV